MQTDNLVKADRVITGITCDALFTPLEKATSGIGSKSIGLKIVSVHSIKGNSLTGFTKAAANEVEQFQRIYRKALEKVLRSQYSLFEELDITKDIEKILKAAEEILGKDLVNLKSEREARLTESPCYP